MAKHALKYVRPFYNIMHEGFITVPLTLFTTCLWQKVTTVSKLLGKDRFVATQQSNIKTLPTEMKKVKNGSSYKILNEIFQLPENDNYNLR